MSSHFDRQYAELMQTVWKHPANDQRPAVIRLLKPLRGKIANILDIGSGDAYYLGLLMPKTYTLVEPNPILREVAVSRAADLRINTRVFSNVATMLRSWEHLAPDLVLMIHVLLYMKPQEIQLLLPRLKNKPLVIIHPWPKSSTTIRFEDSIGLNNSRQRIALKRYLLGRPDTRQVVFSHLRLPLSTNIESFAFLIAHRTLDEESDRERIDLARSFVQRRLHLWRCLHWYDIPQAELLETHNLAKFAGVCGN